MRQVTEQETAPMILHTSRWLEEIETRLDVADDLYGSVAYGRYDMRTDVPQREGDSTE